MGYNAYPIWNEIEACVYKSSKSFGAKDTNHFKQYVGSSAKNSHLHLTFITTKRHYQEFKGYKNVWVFRTSIDDIIIKESIFSNNNNNPGNLLKQISKLTHLKSL